MAVIGANGRGMEHVPAAATQHLVALVGYRRRPPLRRRELVADQQKLPKPKEFVDFRKMFDEMASQIDAVFVATPDHTHAAASLAAIRAGKHVYCEKPLTHDIYEARLLGDEARKHKVMTQMGNQGHGGDGIRRLREYPRSRRHRHRDRGPLLAGPALWDPHPPSRRAGAGGSHWDEWLGPTPKIPYRPGLAPSVGGQNDDTGVGEGWYQLKPYGTGPAALRRRPRLRPAALGPATEVSQQLACAWRQRAQTRTPGAHQPAVLRVPPAEPAHGQVLLVRRLSAGPARPRGPAGMDR